MSDRYLEERLGADVLVYDQAERRAYALERPDIVKCWRDARTDKSRRALLAAAVTLGAATILAPTPAEACSNPKATGHCGRGEDGRPCNRADGSCGTCSNGACR